MLPNHVRIEDGVGRAFLNFKIGSEKKNCWYSQSVRKLIIEPLIFQ